MSAVLLQIALPILAHFAAPRIWAAHIHEMRIVTAIAAIQQAQKIQLLLRKSGKCLLELSGWTPDQEGRGIVLITTVKVSGKRLTFECDQAKKKYLIDISYPRDDFGYVEGTFRGPLKINYWREHALRSEAIPENAEIRGLAELLSR